MSEPGASYWYVDALQGAVDQLHAMDWDNPPRAEIQRIVRVFAADARARNLNPDDALEFMEQTVESLPRLAASRTRYRVTLIVLTEFARAYYGSESTST